jgi:Transcriptional regulator
MEVFVKNGIDRTSLSDIAEHLGTTKSYFYFHFSSKEDLVFSIQKYIMDSAISYLESTVAKNITPAEKIKSWIDWNLDRVKERRVEVDFMYQAMFSKYISKFSRERREEILEIHRKYINLVGEVIKEGQEMGIFKNPYNPTVLATFMVGSLFSGIKVVYLGIEDADYIKESLKFSFLMMLGYEGV